MRASRPIALGFTFFAFLAPTLITPTLIAQGHYYMPPPGLGNAPPTQPDDPQSRPAPSPNHYTIGAAPDPAPASSPDQAPDQPARRQAPPPDPTPGPTGYTVPEADGSLYASFMTTFAEAIDFMKEHMVASFVCMVLIAPLWAMTRMRRTRHPYDH